MSKSTRERLKPVDGTAKRPVYYDDVRGTYHAWCDATDYEPVSTALLMAVSEVVDVEPVDLEPLSKRVDPDALNALVVHWYGSRSSGRDSSITFPFAECDVTVHADGEIEIDPDRMGAGPVGS